MYRDAREQVEISREEAAFRLHIGSRTLANYEAEQTIPAPDVVLGMSKLYRMPEITHIYCHEYCAIGQAYSYETLTAIDMGLPAVILKLVSEMREAQAVLNTLIDITVNKRARVDFTESEWSNFCQALQELFDVEHNIEILKLALGKMSGAEETVVELISGHNQKCEVRGYTKRKRPLVTAAR